MKRVSSFTRRILPSGDSQSKYWSLVDRVGRGLQSSADLNNGLVAAVVELGQTLDAIRCSVVLRVERAIRQAASYSAPGVPVKTQERLEQVDAEIARTLSSDRAVTEVIRPTPDSRIGLLLPPTGRSTRGFATRSILAAPLVIDSQLIGAIVLYGKGARRWSAQEKHCVQAISSCLSLTIYQAQSQEKARSAMGREALANRLLSAIRTAVGVDGVLKVAVEGLGTTLGVTRAVIYMRARSADGKTSSDGSAFEARSEYRETVLVPSLLGAELDIHGSPLPERLRAGEVVSIPDASESHPIVRAISVRLGVRALAFAPISYNEQTVGVLTLEQFERPREFSEDEIALIRLVAEQTAVALRQAELYREAEEAARREALISKITSAIHSSLDSDAVLQSIVNELGAALSVCRCRLALLPNPLPERLPVTHEYTAPCCEYKPAMLQTIPVAGNAHLGAVLSTDQPVATDDVSSDPGFAANLQHLEAGRVKSVLAKAIRLGGKPIGVFSLHHCEKQHRWTQWEIDVVQSVAEQAAVAIRQAELYREARESATRAALVNQIVAAIRQSLDLEETLKAAVEQIGRALSVNRTSFRKVVGSEIVVVAEHLSEPGLPVSDVTESPGNYIASYLRETRRTLVIDDVRAFVAAHSDLAATVRVWQTEPLIRSQIVCPIVVNDQLWGALSIAQTDHLRKWTASDIALVEVVTAQIAVAISHSQLFEEAKGSARREALISHIIHGINQSSQLDEIFPVAARALGRHLACDRLLIVTFDDEAGLLTVDCEYDQGQVTRPGRVYRTETFSAIQALLEDGVLVCDDVESDPRLRPYVDTFLRAVRSRAFLATNLAASGSPRLAIVAMMNSSPRAWTADEIEVTRAAAGQVVIALERAELFEQVCRGKVEWEATFDALNDGIFIFDQFGLLRRVNQAAAAFEGAQARDLIGRRCCTLLQGIEGETCRVADVIKTGRPVTFELMPERLSRPVLVTISPLGRAGGRDELRNGIAGRIADLAPGAVCIVRDLSELRAAEAAAREQRGFLIKLIEHANDAIFALSPEGRFVWFNEQLVKLSGYSRDELVVSDYRRFLPPADKKIAVERFTRALAGHAQTFEMRGLKKSGEARLLLITYTPIYDEGRVTSVLSIARDVTEERLASERAAQADKLRALGQLASGVAHNFNNILAAVLGHAQLIKRDCGDDRTLERIEIIERAALDGAETVKRIQGFGLQQSESADEAVDLSQLVQDSTDLTRARWCDDAQARGIRYEVELDLKELPPVTGSASDLREVFVNIILNALDAMPQGGCLSIKTEATSSVARVSFTDSGIGMSRELCEHIFEPFFTTKGATGVGLGLAVSYSIVERHGGRIDVRSEPGHGSTFTITLPVAQVVHPRAHRDAAPEVEAASVLVIDDDERVRKAIVGMLSSAGHRAEQAASGREALAKMERGQFSVVLTDLAMPEMDGWAVASEIRRRWPGVKIILITGYAISPEALRRRPELVNDVVFKPVRFDDISTTLSQVLT